MGLKYPTLDGFVRVDAVFLPLPLAFRLPSFRSHVAPSFHSRSPKSVISIRFSLPISSNRPSLHFSSDASFAPAELPLFLSPSPCILPQSRRLFDTHNCLPILSSWTSKTPSFFPSFSLSPSLSPVTMRQNMPLPKLGSHA